MPPSARDRTLSLTRDCAVAVLCVQVDNDSICPGRCRCPTAASASTAFFYSPVFSLGGDRRSAHSLSCLLNVVFALGGAPAGVIIVAVIFHVVGVNDDNCIVAVGRHIPLPAARDDRTLAAANHAAARSPKQRLFPWDVQTLWPRKGLGRRSERVIAKPDATISSSLSSSLLLFYLPLFSGSCRENREVEGRVFWMLERRTRCRQSRAERRKQEENRVLRAAKFEGGAEIVAEREGQRTPEMGAVERQASPPSLHAVGQPRLSVGNKSIALEVGELWFPAKTRVWSWSRLPINTCLPQKQQYYLKTPMKQRRGSMLLSGRIFRNESTMHVNHRQRNSRGSQSRRVMHYPLHG
jgi:hypothetical protein